MGHTSAAVLTVVVCCAGLAFANALPLAGLNGALLAEGVCSTSAVSSGQQFDFNLRGAEADEGHYSVRVRKDVEFNTSDVVLNISFYFQCTRRSRPVPRPQPSPLPLLFFHLTHLFPR